MKKYRAIAVDMDRTLLRSGGGLSLPSCDVLAEARRAGVKVVVATARGLSGKLKLEGVDCFDALVMHNGAHVELGGKSVVREVLSGAEIAEYARRILPLDASAIRWALEDRSNSFNPADPQDAYKLYIPLSDALTADAIFSALPPELEAVIVDQGTLAIVARTGVTKMTGIRALLDIWGLSPEDVIAFGDDANDLPMLRGCGQPVVMSNGDAAVLSQFSEHALPNDEDGVGKWLLAHRALWEDKQ